MKTVFIYDGLHMVHKNWAESINAEFVPDKIPLKYYVPNVTRVFRTLLTLSRIPKDARIAICDSGSQIILGALWKGKNPDKKLVLIVSDPKLYYLPKMSFIKRKMYEWALKKYDLFIPTSPLMESLIPKGLKGEKRVVYPFFDTEKFSKKEADLESKNLIFIGQIVKEKGLDYLVDTYKLLRPEFPESKLYIVGQGKMKRELEDMNIDGITFAGWTDNPEEYFSKASIYINLARLEPAGIVVLEAMCMGIVPVVSENVGYEYAVREVSDELVVKDSEDAAKIITKLLESPVLLKEYSEKCRKTARKYDKENSIKLFKETIESLYAA